MTHAHLVQAVADTNDAAAGEEFVRRYWNLIAKVVYRRAQRCRPSSGIVDELIQQTFQKLWDNDRRVLKMFESRHPDAIYGYLAQVTANLVRDYFKAQNPSDKSIDSDDVDTLVDQNSQEKDMHREVLIEQIHACLDKYTSGPNKQRDLDMFWFHFRHGFSAREIASIFGLETKGVESVIHRLKQLARSKLTEGPAPLGAGQGDSA
jgi:RNA polymerase sigma factor (sigma-70 family)